MSLQGKLPRGAAAASPGFQRALVLELGGSEQQDLLGWLNQPSKVFLSGQGIGGRRWIGIIPLLSWDLY